MFSYSLIANFEAFIVNCKNSPSDTRELTELDGNEDVDETNELDVSNTGSEELGVSSLMEDMELVDGVSAIRKSHL